MSMVLTTCQHTYLNLLKEIVNKYDDFYNE